MERIGWLCGEKEETTKILRNNSLTLMFNPKYEVPSFVTPSLLQAKRASNMIIAIISVLFLFMMMIVLSHHISESVINESLVQGRVNHFQPLSTQKTTSFLNLRAVYFI